VALAAGTKEEHILALAETARDIADKGAVTERPTTKAHGPALQPTGLSTWRRVMLRTRSIAIKLTGGSVAALLSMAGLAYAGVDLPGTAAEQAFESVLGVELPNQGDNGQPEDAGKPADTGNDVSGAASDPEAEKGCEFGQSISELASQDSTDHRQDAESSGNPDPCELEEQEPNGSGETGETKSAEGKANAEEKSTAGQSHGADDNEPNGSGETGETKSAEGKANKPTDTTRP
jgi:hypothetical protein